MTEHDKGLGRAKKLCLALSSTRVCGGDAGELHIYRKKDRDRPRDDGRR